MRIPSQLKNTNQVGHLYAGIKGIGGNKIIDFEAKYDYAEYADLPFLVNAVTASNQFDVQYRGGLEKVQVSNFTGNLNLNFSTQFTSSIKFNHVIYQQLGVKFQAPHIPQTSLTWTNSWKLSPKIIVAPEVYWLNKLYALNPVKNQLIQLDDILDVTADSATLGKTAGKDQANDKPTFVSLLGLAGAQAQAQALLQEALAALDAAKLRDDGALRALAHRVVQRDR